MDITVHDLKAARDSGEDLLLLDVRNPDEVSYASLHGAKHIPMREIPARLAELEPWRNKRIAVLCHMGARSARVQNFLFEQGFRRAENVAGGIHHWSLEIDPSVPTY